MKQRLLIKLLSAIITSICVTMFVATASFRHEDWIMIVLFGTFILLIIFGLIGIPLSLLIDLLSQKMTTKSKAYDFITACLLYGIGGIAAFVIFYILSERERLNRLFEQEMGCYYVIAISSSVAFFVIESILKRIFLKWQRN
ncbi:hypothetical protein [Paenibacillus sp. YPG26]|uniref:hypothetical protein n=1 Tax=Paenibacillus sp. YPG26 TaxID=2878915 RepID=UPI00204157A9|nr:hypothetical protein [Paenibacillus sp. YPG26]USB31754.1 hypothetical protein LDO05_10355 [Paenibacillus sp. YPG26]